MATSGWLNAVEIMIAIFAVWFALVGWKLLPLLWSNRNTSRIGLSKHGAAGIDGTVSEDALDSPR